MSAVLPAPSDRSLVLPIGITSVAALAVLAWILVLREPPAGDTAALAFMPAVNAAMNSLSAACLVLGLVAIRSKKTELHRRFMLGAFVFSSLFLLGYLAYHYVHGDTRYPEGAPLRGLYVTLLASHVILSIVALPMVLFTFALALRSSFQRHRRLARWTLPIWLYVSVTGVLVFLFLRSAA